MENLILLNAGVLLGVHVVLEWTFGEDSKRWGCCAVCDSNPCLHFQRRGRGLTILGMIYKTIGICAFWAIPYVLYAIPGRAMSLLFNLSALLLWTLWFARMCVWIGELADGG